MFYIKFNGYKKEKEERTGLFFSGHVYPCNVVDSGRNYQVTDENGDIIKFNSITHNSHYNFSRFDMVEETISEMKNGMNVGECYEFEINKTEQIKKDLAYRMNGVEVTKSFFEDKLREVELLKSRGVSVFVDFEVSF